MDLIQIDQEKCKQDGICAQVCPARVINFEKGTFPTPTADAEEVCIQCGHCVAVCPHGALSHRIMAPDQCPPVQKDLFLSPEHCEHFLRARRSIRVYKDKEVPREEIQKLIETSRYAPTGHNSQCVEWLVITDKSELKKITGLICDWMGWMIQNMPEIAQNLHMDRTVKAYEEGIDGILRGAPVLVVTHAHKDMRYAVHASPIALTYTELAAASMGLGACWAGYFYAAATTFPPLGQALALPQDHITYGGMMIGYPKFSYTRLPLRNDPPITWR